MKEDDKSVPDALTREMVQRTTLRLNVTQEVIVITDDKAYRCLHQWRDKIESRKAWIAPVSLLTPLVLAFATADFRDSLGLSKNTWQAIFILSILFAAAWVVQSLRYRFGKNVLSVEELIEELKEDSTVQQRPETGALDVVTVPNKVLRDQMPEITRETGPLHIINAEYGTDQHRIPVTEKLNAAINNGRLSIFVGNNIAGDPCPNFPKYLLVSYSVDGKISTRRVAEGILLVLP